MEKQNINTVELAKIFWENFTSNEFADLANNMGEYDCETWSRMVDETLYNPQIDNNGINFLKAMGKVIISDDIDLLKHRIDSIDEYKYGDFCDYEAHEAARECATDIISIITKWWERLDEKEIEMEN